MENGLWFPTHLAYFHKNPHKNCRTRLRCTFDQDIEETTGFIWASEKRQSDAEKAAHATIRKAVEPVWSDLCNAHRLATPKQTCHLRGIQESKILYFQSTFYKDPQVLPGFNMHFGISFCKIYEIIIFVQIMALVEREDFRVSHHGSSRIPEANMPPQGGGRNSKYCIFV